MKDRKKLRNLIAVLLVFLGGILMGYPFLSNFLYEHNQKKVIFHHQNVVEQQNKEMLKEEYKEAERYNQRLYNKEVILLDPFSKADIKRRNSREYLKRLNLNHDGMMGMVEIPKISVRLPIYHGTTEEVLNKGVGHLENTSLPIGGKGTHAVLSAHTGLTDKKMFTDLELLEKGDMFYLRILGRNLAYQIDDIRVVKPEDTSHFSLVRQKDYVTLVTCTPYGVNSHRLLVRGSRVPYDKNEKQQLKPTERSSQWMQKYVRTLGIGIMFLLAVFVSVLYWQKKKS